MSSSSFIAAALRGAQAVRPVPVPPVMSAQAPRSPRSPRATTPVRRLSAGDHQVQTHHPTVGFTSFPPKQTNTTAPADLSGMCVLVVDDMSSIRRTISLALAKMGCAVCEAEDGAAALATLRRTSVDCVITDICMPGMDGFELVSSMKTSASLRNIPVFIISGAGEEDEMVKSIELGALFIRKPIIPGELCDHLQRVLGSRKKKVESIAFIGGVQSESVLLRHMIEEMGFCFDVFESGDEFLRPTERERTYVTILISGVLTEGGASSLDTLRAIQRSDALGKIPVLVFTSSAAEDLHEFIAAGCHDVIEKPLVPVAAAFRIKQSVRKYHLRAWLNKQLVADAPLSADASPPTAAGSAFRAVALLRDDARHAAASPAADDRDAQDKLQKELAAAKEQLNSLNKTLVERRAQIQALQETVLSSQVQLQHEQARAASMVPLVSALPPLALLPSRVPAVDRMAASLCARLTPLQQSILDVIDATFRDAPRVARDAPQMQRLTMGVCKLPSYFSRILWDRVASASAPTIDRDAFVSFWSRRVVFASDRKERTWAVLSDGDVITGAGVRAVLEELARSHPDLKGLPPDHFVQVTGALIAALVGGASREGIARRKYRCSALADEWYQVDQASQPCSTSLLSRRMVLATAHSFQTCSHMQPHVIFEQASGEFAICDFVLQRVFQEVPMAFTSGQRGRMNLFDFTFFTQAEQDRMGDWSVPYWFRCLDVDGDGWLSEQDLFLVFRDKCRQLDTGDEADARRRLALFPALFRQLTDMTRTADPRGVQLCDLMKIRKLRSPFGSTQEVFNIFVSTTDVSSTA
jgi:DNA-binding response OmpR family regulator